MNPIAKSKKKKQCFNNVTFILTKWLNLLLFCLRHVTAGWGFLMSSKQWPQNSHFHNIPAKYISCLRPPCLCALCLQEQKWTLTQTLRTVSHCSIGETVEKQWVTTLLAGLNEGSEDSAGKATWKKWLFTPKEKNVKGWLRVTFQTITHFALVVWSSLGSLCSSPSFCWLVSENNLTLSFSFPLSSLSPLCMCV